MRSTKIGAGHVATADRSMTVSRKDRVRAAWGASHHAEDCECPRCLEVYKIIEIIRDDLAVRALRNIVAHWAEFGPEHGFEEKVHNGWLLDKDA